MSERKSGALGTAPGGAGVLSSSNGERLLTALSIALLAVGLSVIACPFLLVARQAPGRSDIVVQPMERNLPLFREERTFQMPEEATVASIPVAPAPLWIAEETIAASIPQSEAPAALMAEWPDLLPAQSAEPRSMAVPVETPQPSVPIAFDDLEFEPVQQQPSFLASLPDLSPARTLVRFWRSGLSATVRAGARLAAEQGRSDLLASLWASLLYRWRADASLPLGVAIGPFPSLIGEKLDR
jgi:hypothetical protein